MKTKCLICDIENPKHGMKTCCRKCADEYKKKINSSTRECVYCKNSFTVRNSNKKILCSEECRKVWHLLPENISLRLISAKKATTDKYGVDNVFKLDKFQKLSRERKKEIYGDENYNNWEKMMVTKEDKYGKQYLDDFNKRISKVLLEKSGVTHGLHIQKFKDKQIATVQKKYGVDYVSQNKEIKAKQDKTIKERYGVDNISQSEEFKQKKKDTSMKNFGVDHHLKDYNRLQKHLMISYKVKKYKETMLTYQGSYEYHFINLLDKHNKLDILTNGSSFDYEFLGNKHVYHTDFILDGVHIEIKSGWTYDGNGTNDLLKQLNHTKWAAVESNNQKLIVLKSKQEINTFINYLLSIK